MNTISGVYKITNTITGDFYIGSSNNVKRRFAEHKCPSIWNKYPNKQLYQDMKKLGVDKFELQVIAEVEIEKLKEIEQYFIETLKPTYNSNRAKGWDIERKKESDKKYEKTDKRKEYKKKYEKTDKRKEYRKKYQSQLCCYNGEVLTLNALRKRFSRAGITHPQIEAKKYLLNKSKDNIKENK